MVEEDTINLLDEITEQKNNDLIIFTTFTFDPIFFDAYILQKLRRNNPKATIIVLMDFGLYSRLYEKHDFTEVTGVEYALLPIQARKVFHSKIFMFISESKKQIFLGSHNLTLSGLGQNLELCFSSNDIILFENCINYINSLLKERLDSEDEVYKEIEKYVNGMVTEQKLLHNENEAILDQCLREVSKQLISIEEVIIFSPFFSETEKLIEKIMTLNPTEIKLCIQKNNHDLDPTTVSSFKKLSLYEVCNKRRLHSKFIAFRSSDKNLILIGSPNFTKPALLETSKDGNFESAILFPPNSNNFIDLKIEPITENEIKDSRREVFEQTNPQTRHYDVVITLAYFDDFGILHVTYKSGTKKSLTLESYDKLQEKISTKAELEAGLHSIPFHNIPEKIIEICFTENNETVSNLFRVCNKKAFKSRTQLDLSNSSSVEKIVFGDMNIPDILFAIFPVTDKRISDTGEKKDSEKGPLPGRFPTSKSSSGFYDLIRKMLKISSKTKIVSTSGEKHTSQKNVKQHEINEIVKKILAQLYRKFKDYIITSKDSVRYWLFLWVALMVIRELESKHELGIECARIITQLNEIIEEDQSFSELGNIDRMKIFLLLEVLTKQYYKNLGEPYTFDATDTEILCAFKPMITETAETYRIEQGIPEQIKKWLKKHPELMNKINSQAQFDVDEQELDAFKAKLRKLSDSI